MDAKTDAGVFSLLREAVRGSRQDFTDGPLGRAIVLLAVPMVLEMSMESIFAVADIFFVGRLGPDAVATVGLTESMLYVLYAVAMGLSIGATALVARRIGEKNPEGASVAAAQAIALGAGLSVVIGVFGFVFARPLLAGMGASPGVLEQGAGYTRVMFAGSASILLLFLINAIQRGSGDAASAMRTLWLANSINIALGPCLIFGLGPFPKLGVVGAAVATTIGRSSGVLYGLSRLLLGKNRVTLPRRNLKIDLEVMATMVRLSGSGILQTMVGMLSWIGMTRIVSSFGSSAVAGYIIAMRIVMFALLPSWGMSNAAATRVGQSLGAQKPERAEAAVWKAGFYNVVFLGGVGALFVTLAGPITGLFTSDAQVAFVAARALRIISAGFLFYAYGMVMNQAFNGAGDATTPMLVTLVIFWFGEIPLAYALALPLGFGPTGVFVSVAIAFSAFAVVSAVLFRRGRWKLRKV